MKRMRVAGLAAVGLLLGPTVPASAQDGWSDELIPPRNDTFSVLDTAASGDGVTWAFGGWYPALGHPVFRSQAYLRGTDGWAEVPVPDIGRLSGSAVVAADDVWAVGQHSKSGVGQSVHWDGAQWTAVPFAPPGPSARLGASDVAAFAPDDVWAVGGIVSDDPAAEGRGMVQRWDGSAWSDVAVPDVSGTWSLSDIGGTAPNDLWAVGEREGTPDQGVVLHWDGTAWSETTVPDIGGSPTQDVRLTGVAARAADDVWATGTLFSYDSNPSLPILLHWNGTEWSVQEAPVATGELGRLVRTGDQLWALGSAVLRYDGTTWQQMDGPATGTPVAGTALDDGRLLAVGSAGPSHQRQPLVSVHNG